MPGDRGKDAHLRPHVPASVWNCSSNRTSGVECAIASSRYWTRRVGLSAALFVADLSCSFFEIQETVALSADWASQVTGGSVQPGDIMTLERLLLVSLNWDLDRCTAAEVARVLLSMWAPGHDFDEFLKESDCFANACYPVASVAICCGLSLLRIRAAEACRLPRRMAAARDLKSANNSLYVNACTSPVEVPVPPCGSFLDF